MTDRRPPAASPKGRMVRTILLAGGTLALLGGLFAIYWQFLPSHRPATTEAGGVPVVAPRPLATTAPGGGTLGKIGAGTAPWVSQFDDDNALISQFRSEEFLPQPDQTVKLVGPEFKVRLGNGQMMHLVAAGGDVYVAPPAPTKKNPLGMGSQQMPSHGKLYDVTVRIFPTWATDADAARPTATIERLQNVAFDNDASRVYTDAYTAPDGTTIPGDRVPVHVRGDAFDLDGHGLTLRWDDQGGQLQLLEIAHGGRLVVRDAKALGDVTGQPTTSQARRPNAEVGDPAFAVLNVTSGYQHASPSPRTRGEGGGEGRSPGIAPRRPPLSLTLSPSSGRGNWTHATPLGLALATGTGGSGAPALASTDPAAATAVLPPTTQKAAVPYRATLADDVKVEQAGVTLGTGDRLTVDFLGEAMKTTADEPPRKPASKKPQGTKKPKAPVSSSWSGDGEAEQVAVVRLAAAEVGPGHTPSPAPPGATPEAPIVITWTGKLRIAPLGATKPLAELTRGEAAAELAGAPAVLTREAAAIRCAAAVYRTGDGGVSLRSSTQVPLVVASDPHGHSLTTPGIEYDGGAHVATVAGPGQLRAPSTTQPAAGQAVETLSASWATVATIHLLGGGENASAASPTGIERADLEGDVKIEHPRLGMTAQALSLLFEPGPKRGGGRAESTLRKVVATEDVHCVAADAGASAARDLTCQRLEVTTGTDDAGKLVVRHVHASGDVVGKGQGSELRADQVAATLDAVSPAEESEPAGAARDVAADRVVLRELTAAGNVRLQQADGSAATGDTLRVLTDAARDPQIELSGAPATVVSRDGKVSGKSLVYDQAAHVVRLSGAGTLVSAPRPGAAAGTRPATVTWSQGAVLDGRAGTIDVTGDVEVTSVDAKNATQTARGRQMTVYLLDAPAAATRPGSGAKGKPATSAAATPLGGTDSFLRELRNKQPGRVVITGGANVTQLDPPLGGRSEPAREFHLLTEQIDYDQVTGRMRVPGPGRMLYVDRRPATATTQATGGDPAGLGGGGPGNTAVVWSGWLDVDERARQVVVEKDVRIRHEPLGGGKPFDMTAATLVVEFAPPAAGAAASAAQQVRQVTAKGPVTFAGEGLQFSAGLVTYDPTTQILVASGTDRFPAEVLDESGTTTSSVDTLRYNLKTGGVSAEGVRGAFRP